MTHSGWFTLLASADPATATGLTRREREASIRGAVAALANDGTAGALAKVPPATLAWIGETFALVASTGTQGLVTGSTGASPDDGGVTDDVTERTATALATAFAERLVRASGRMDAKDAGDDGRMDADILATFLPKLARTAGLTDTTLAHCIHCHVDARLGRSLEEQLEECGTQGDKSAEGTREVLPDAIKRAAAKVMECRERGRTAASNAVTNLGARGDLSPREGWSLALVLGLELPGTTRVAPASASSNVTPEEGTLPALPGAILECFGRPSVSAWFGGGVDGFRGTTVKRTAAAVAVGRLVRTGEVTGEIRTALDVWLAALPADARIAIAAAAASCLERAEGLLYAYVSADPLLRGTAAERFTELGLAKRATTSASPDGSSLWEALALRDDAESLATILSMEAMVSPAMDTDDATWETARLAARFDAVLGTVATDLASILPNTTPDPRVRALLDRVAWFAKATPTASLLAALRAAKHTPEGGLSSL
ncbi:MAG: hypothetical protein U0169_18685 [Polyangiaceae bacterium]